MSYLLVIKSLSTFIIENGFASAYLFLDSPSVSLQLGSSLNPEDIEEGDDCYFDCKIEANPRIYKVVWKHNVSMHDLNM